MKNKEDVSKGKTIARTPGNWQVEFPHMWVNPRKSNVSGLASPRRFLVPFNDNQLNLFRALAKEARASTNCHSLLMLMHAICRSAEATSTKSA
jgi:hypothetical protein